MTIENYWVLISIRVPPLLARQARGVGLQYHTIFNFVRATNSIQRMKP